MSRRNAKKTAPDPHVPEVIELLEPTPPLSVPDDLDNILEVKTISGSMFKILLESLKAVLNDANLVFSKKGLSMTTIDTNRKAVVHLSMDASSFEKYYCREKITLGVDINLLHKLIKTNKMNDTLCFMYKESQRDKLIICFKNEEKCSKVVHELPLKSLEEYQVKEKLVFSMPPLEINSIDFQNICRDMASLQTTRMEIQIVGDEISFISKDGQTRPRQTLRIQSQGNLDNPTTYEIARGIFDLKFLQSFAKATNLSPRVKLYLQSGSFILIEYNLNANMGVLKYMLSPEEG